MANNIYTILDKDTFLSISIAHNYLKPLPQTALPPAFTTTLEPFCTPALPPAFAGFSNTCKLVSNCALINARTIEILVHVAILKEIFHKSDRFWGLFILKSSNLTKPWQICQILWSYLADFEISVRFHRTHTYFHSCNA